MSAEEYCPTDEEGEEALRCLNQRYDCGAPTYPMRTAEVTAHTQQAMSLPSRSAAQAVQQKVASTTRSKITAAFRRLFYSSDAASGVSNPASTPDAATSRACAAQRAPGVSAVSVPTTILSDTAAASADVLRGHAVGNIGMLSSGLPLGTAL